MIDFACKKIQLDEIIMCSLGLTRLDYEILSLLFAHPSLTIIGIAKKMRVDRTTAQKSVKRLLEKGLLLRFQQNLKTGGYSFIYETKGKEEVKQNVADIIGGWQKNVMRALDAW